MSSPRIAGRTSETTAKASSQTDVIGRTRADLEFWINCMGTPLLVVEKLSLTVRFANRSAEAFFGTTAEAFHQCPMARLVGDKAERLLEQIWNRAADGTPGEPLLIPCTLRGEERTLMTQLTPLIVDGEPLRLYSFTDAPPQGSVALAGWQENIIAILNWLPFGFEIANLEDEIQFANAQNTQLFGFKPHELQTPDDWWRLAYPDPDYREFAKSKWETEIAAARAENREMTPFDLEVTTRSNGQRTIQFRHRTIGNFNINLFLDVTRERAYANELKVLADTDPLTEAMNRRRFFEEAAKIYAAATSPPQAILMLDIDHFKRINDVYGHGTGDLVLQEFTRRCRHVVRQRDLLARLGGEEFAVLIGGSESGKAVEIAERMRRDISASPFDVAGTELAVTVSIGVALRGEDENSVDLTVSRADKALYEAKNAGRNRVVLAH